MAGVLSCVPCDCKWNQWMLNLRLYEAGQGGNSAPGKCGFCSHNKTDCWENFFLLLFILWQELSEAVIPQFVHGLQWLCNAFVPQCAMRSPLSLLLKHKSYYTPGSWFYNYMLFIFSPARNRIQAQKDNITIDYILPILYILQHPKLNFLASGLCR